VIILDTDVVIDIRRGIPTAVAWFSSLPETEMIILPGFVAMELVMGTKDKKDLRDTKKWLSRCRIVWIEPNACQTAYQRLMDVHLGNAVSVLDALIAQVAISMNLPLYTFNQKHFDAIPKLKTIQPYNR
jgi:predicted nucleic acid-binding protein